MNNVKYQLKREVSIENLIKTAKILKSDNNQNPEYDRALTELIAMNIPSINSSELDELIKEVNEFIND